jgi:hypothetical protein
VCNPDAGAGALPPLSSSSLGSESRPSMGSDLGRNRTRLTGLRRYRQAHVDLGGRCAPNRCESSQPESSGADVEPIAFAASLWTDRPRSTCERSLLAFSGTSTWAITGAVPVKSWSAGLSAAPSRFEQRRQRCTQREPIGKGIAWNLRQPRSWSSCRPADARRLGPMTETLVAAEGPRRARNR